MGKMGPSARQVQQDRALTLKYLINGTMRWEWFPGKSGGELCLLGIRHTCDVDEWGCPVLTDHLRSILTSIEKKEFQAATKTKKKDINRRGPDPDAERLKRARIMVENVLWNLDHSTEGYMGNATTRECWRTVFNELRDTLG